MNSDTSIVPALAKLPSGEPTLLIDSTTLDIDVARDVAHKAEQAGAMMVDAPVSGGRYIYNQVLPATTQVSPRRSGCSGRDTVIYGWWTPTIGDTSRPISIFNGSTYHLLWAIGCRTRREDLQQYDIGGPADRSRRRNAFRAEDGSQT